jgi:hypothetical protein
VKTLKERYDWDADVLRAALVPKLKGTAKIWLNSIDDELLTLEDLFVELDEQFSENMTKMGLHGKM